MGSVTVSVLVMVAVVTATGYFLVRYIAYSQRTQLAPQHRPLWMGPDLLEVTEVVREQMLVLLAQGGYSGIVRHPASDELAQHHAYAMAARGFCSAIDPEGEGPEQRLQRLHPKMVMTLVEWERSVDALNIQDPLELAKLLLSGPGANGKQLDELLTSGQFNLLGVSASGSASRASLCIVLGHHWATIVKDRPQIERPESWVVAAELVEGTRCEQLSAALLTESGLQLGAVQAEPFSNDDWPDQRICVYPAALENMEGARIQWRRDGIDAVPVSLP